jgi:4-hydroxybenzoate polyprenyltransferase
LIDADDNMKRNANDQKRFFFQSGPGKQIRHGRYNDSDDMKISRFSNPLSFFQRMWIYGRMIKFQHTVFALPFALSAMVLASQAASFGIVEFCWILLAMVGARSAAMGFNRMVDAGFDARNPRTSRREIPAGKLSMVSAGMFVMASSGLFVFAAAMLGSLAFRLAIPVLIVLFFYSYTKRFTSLCHLYLGFAISLAPMGIWIALTNTFSWSIGLLSLALMTYIAGFDILYACQDIDFDQQSGLFSLPSQLGVKKALTISSLLHICSAGCFFLMYFVFDLGWIYFVTVLIIAGLFRWEHRLVQPDDLSRVPVAFFHINSVISVVLFLGILADVWLMG